MQHHLAASPLPLLIAALALPSLAQAQVVESVFVNKLKLHTQTSATQVSLNAPSSLPFGFDVNVDGMNIELLSPAPTVTGPISLAEPFHNGGVLGLDVADGYWRYGATQFNGWGTQTQAELDSLFGSGVYTFNVAGVSVPLTLTGDQYPAAPPLITLSGGTWANGVYTIVSDQALSITTSAYPGYGTHADDAVAVDVYGPNFEAEVLHLASQNPQNFVSLVIPANTLIPGNDYDVLADFAAATSFSLVVPGLPGAMSGAIYDLETRLTVVVVPPGPGTPYCLGDGSGTPCPCGNDNDGSNGLAGCASGASSGGVAVTGVGNPSVSADSVVLNATGAQPNQPGLWFQADNAVNGGQGIIFGDGLRCAGGNIVRLGVVISDLSGNSSSPPGLGLGLSGGDVKRYQLWYRNPAGSPCGTNFNLSNGYEIAWTL